MVLGGERETSSTGQDVAAAGEAGSDRRRSEHVYDYYQRLTKMWKRVT